MLIRQRESIFPREDNYTGNIYQKARYLRHLPQNISKPHFSAIDAPEENPLPGNTSLAWHISFTKSVVPIYRIPLSSPGKITGLYIER